MLKQKLHYLKTTYVRWRTTSTATTPCSTSSSTPAPLVQPQVPPVQPMQPAQPQLKCSHFKPEFSGKPEDNAEAHLLRTNDWMKTHAFPKAARQQRFCLTLLGEARLWYESIRPIAVGRNRLQGQFRQQYSEIGNTGEQPFHAWRSSHYGKNTKTLDTYVTRIRQVAALLVYG